MNMSQDTENFEQVRRLLKLKRYEQPPPRYFNDFSAQVIDRIKRGERGEENALAGWVLWEAAWLQRIWAAFEAKPVLAGAFGLGICATLITGMIYSEKSDIEPVALIPVAESPTAGSVKVREAMGMHQPLLANPRTLEGFSTERIPALQPDGSVPSSLQAQPISFTFPGQN